MTSRWHGLKWKKSDDSPAPSVIMHAARGPGRRRWHLDGAVSWRYCSCSHRPCGAGNHERFLCLWGRGQQRPAPQRIGGGATMKALKSSGDRWWLQVTWTTCFVTPRHRGRCVSVSALVFCEYVKLTGWKEARRGILTCVCWQVYLSLSLQSGAPPDTCKQATTTTTSTKSTATTTSSTTTTTTKSTATKTISSTATTTISSSATTTTSTATTTTNTATTTTNSTATKTISSTATTTTSTATTTSNTASTTTKSTATKTISSTATGTTSTATRTTTNTPTRITSPVTTTTKSTTTTIQKTVAWQNLFYLSWSFSRLRLHESRKWQSWSGRLARGPQPIAKNLNCSSSPLAAPVNIVTVFRATDVPLKSQTRALALSLKAPILRSFVAKSPSFKG